MPALPSEPADSTGDEWLAPPMGASTLAWRREGRPSSRLLGVVLALVPSCNGLFTGPAKPSATLIDIAIGSLLYACAHGNPYGNPL